MWLFVAHVWGPSSRPRINLEKTCFFALLFLKVPDCSPSSLFCKSLFNNVNNDNYNNKTQKRSQALNWRFEVLERRMRRRRNKQTEARICVSQWHRYRFFDSKSLVLKPWKLVFSSEKFNFFKKMRKVIKRKDDDADTFHVLTAKRESNFFY